MSEKLYTTKILGQFKSAEVTKLFEYYKEDSKKARVYASTLKKHNLEEHQEILMEFPNGDFKILCYKKTFGVSKTNIVYNSSKLMGGIFYTKKRLYFKQGNNIRPLTMNTLTSYKSLIGFPSRDSGDKFPSFEILDYFGDKFPWFEIFVMKMDFYGGIPLNRILTYKLTNEDKFLKKYFGVPKKVIDVLINHKGSHYSVKGGENCGFKDKHEYWKRIKQNLINVESLTMEFMNNRFFDDACTLAYKLGEKINCKWSDKRLKLEHDRMSKEYTLYQFEFMPLRDLKIKEVYLHFEKYSGFYCFRTNKELVAEGNRLSHCVGGYESQVNNGSCAIFSAHDCTLQVGTSWSNNELQMGQYYGWDNTNPPQEHINEVKNSVAAFNRFYSDYLKQSHKHKPMSYDEFLAVEFGAPKRNELGQPEIKKLVIEDEFDYVFSEADYTEFIEDEDGIELELDDLIDKLD